jgi:hypothetical protein
MVALPVEQKVHCSLSITTGLTLSNAGGFSCHALPKNFA